MGHYGEAGSWGGFIGDPYAVKLKNGLFSCDTLDVCFTNAKAHNILFSYSFNGAFNPTNHKLFEIDSIIDSEYQLSSDHFMSGFYTIIDNDGKE
jgi:hypothetical protein